MAFAQAAQRPIAGAVATQGVSDRVAFLRKTYAHLGGALIAFALFTAGMMRYATALSWKLSTFGGGMGGVVVMLLLFVAVAYGAQKLAMSETSPVAQYAGLGLAVVLWSVLAQPIIWFTILKFGHRDVLAGGGPLLSHQAAMVIGEAAIITLAIFIGLTATVFITRKDFSFMRGMLSAGMFALIGLGLASMLFGFNIGMLYSVIAVLLMAGYILYQTSLVMNYFRPTQHVAAALMLFSTVATLFIHILRIVAESQSSRR